MSDEKRKPPVTEQNKAILDPANKLVFPDPKAPKKKAKDVSRVHPVRQRQMDEEKKSEARKRKS